MSETSVDIFSQSTAAAASLSAIAASPINILIVDDEPRNLTVLETMLDDPGYRLIRAGSPEQALLALLEDDFALLILDVHMPTMTGLELAQLIRERKKTAQVPIIFLTAHYNEAEHILAGYDKGAVDYLHKPVNPAILKSKVSVFARLYRSSRSLAAEVAERRRIEEQLFDLNQSLERRVQERTAALQERAEEIERLYQDLERSHAELDSFAYVASHDLKEPLRGIHNYSEILQTELGDKIDERNKVRLMTLQRLSLRMDQLIDSLLEYGRVGRSDFAFTKVDLNGVVRDALDLLETRIRCDGVEISIPRPLPAVRGDQIRLVEVYTNLIGNAIKYNDKADKHVEIGFTEGEAEGLPVFYVRDNGIGIEENHYGDIFKIFRRLHARDKFGGGSGAGLTITHKVIERHGGKIWLKSVPGAGTTFFFVLGNVSTGAKA